jgi:hypothetical protein
MNQNRQVDMKLKQKIYQCCESLEKFISDCPKIISYIEKNFELLNKLKNR